MRKHNFGAEQLLLYRIDLISKIFMASWLAIKYKWRSRKLRRCSVGNWKRERD